MRSLSKNYENEHENESNEQRPSGDAGSNEQLDASSPVEVILEVQRKVQSVALRRCLSKDHILDQRKLERFDLRARHHKRLDWKPRYHVVKALLYDCPT